MGRYTVYFNDIWELQANRKILGLNLFGTIINNSNPFTPGDMITTLPDVDKAIQLLINKGYDFLFIISQPSNRTKLLANQDFENIMVGAKEMIESLGGRVRNAYYAPGTDKHDPFVRPNIGMWDRAAKENNFSWKEVFFVSAEENDIKPAKKVNATPILISSVKHDLHLTFSSLLDFANSI